MVFLIVKSLKRIRLNIKMYFLISIQLIIGFALVYAALNLWISIDRQYKQVVEGNENKIINLWIISENMNSSISKRKDSIPFDYDDYTYIFKTFKDEMDICYSVKYNYELLVNSNNSEEFAIETVNVMLVSDNFFKFYLNDKVFFNGKCIIGNKAMKILNSGVNISNDNFVPKFLVNYIDSQKQKNNFNIINNIVANEELVFEISKTEGKLDLEYTIFLPINEFSTNKLNNTSSNTFVSFLFIDDKTMGSKGENILSYLYEKHGDDYIYSFDTEAQSFQRKTNGYLILSSGVGVISVFMIVILIISFMGIMLFQFYKRLSEISICLCIGASIFKLSVEVLFETVFITFISSLLGVVIMSFLINFIKIQDIVLQSNFVVGAIIVVVAVFLGVLVAYVPVFNIGKIQPTQIIKSL